MHNIFLQKILQAIQAIECDLIQSNALYCVAVECAKAGQFEKSIELSEMIKSEYYRIQFSIDMAEIYREIGLENKARDRLSFATHLTQSSSTLHPHYYANFSSRIAVQYFALGDEKNIFESLEKSSYPSVKRNQTVANILLAELSKMPSSSNQSLFQAKHYSEGIFRKINNNSELFTILLAELACKQAKKGYFEKALKTLDYLKKSKAGSEKVGKALICLAEQYAQLGNFEVALKMYEEIEDLHMKDLMLSKIAEAYAQFCQFETAIQISSCISCSEIRDITFSDIAEVCATKAELTDLCQVLEQLNSYKIRELSRLKSFVLSTFVSKLAKNQQYVKGIELANKIKSRAYKIEALQSLAESLNMFAKNLQGKSEVDSIYHDLEAILKSANRQKKSL